MPGPYYPPGAYPAPNAYSPPPGAVMPMPGQAYPYASPGPYSAPVVVAPPPMVFVPAPPLPNNAWTVNAEALFLEREPSNAHGIVLGQTFYNSANTPVANTLYTDDSFGLTTGLRLEVSRNFDDITLSGTYWGMQQWSAGNSILADPQGYTVLAYSPFLQTAQIFGALDNQIGYTYSSQIQNVELNALVRLNPSDPYWQVNWLWGARYVYFADNFNLFGIDDSNSTTENFNVTTVNNLFGVQTGLLFVRGWSRVQWEAGLKFGLMANIFRQHGIDSLSAASVVPAGFNYVDTSNTGCGISGLFEVTLAACYRITDNLGIRLGYQFYDLTGMALAPRQLTSFGHGGNVALDGVSIGLQATW